ncbi:MAG TPA: ABC transporter substrate-binding protein [Candidatus Limnocylindria bacterium]|nr:ABC transporter substrate-binding protein [Candidatus Limnocylindria bacterium]
MATRRQFLGDAARLAGGLMIAACVPAPTGGPAAQTATAGAPKRGGELVLADSGTSPTMDPAFSGHTTGRRLFRMIYDPLIDLDEKGNIIPVLAERWETPDPTTIVLHLRQGVTFHDGSKFDAEAVKFHFDRHLDPKTGSLRRSELLALASVTIDGAYAVRLKLKAPDQSFLSTLFDRPGMILSPNAVAKNRDDTSLKPVGTGPFKLVEHVNDDHTTVERNPNYWMKDRPYLDRIRQRSVPTDSTRLIEVRSGNAHIAELVPYQDVERLKSAPEVNVVSIPGSRYYYVVWNVASPYGKSKEFRQALNYLMDRDAMGKAVFYGLGEPAFAPFMAGTAFHDPAYRPFTRDIAKAKALLEKADVPRPFKFTRYMSGDDPVHVKINQILQENYREAGVTMDISFEEGAAATARETRGDFTFTTSNWGTRPDPGQYIGVLHLSTTTQRRFSPGIMKDPEVDRLINAAQVEADITKRKALYRQLSERINDNADNAFIWHAPDVKALRPNVKGFVAMNDFIVRFKDLWLE